MNFPLGVPTNRPKEPGFVPSKRGPGWWVHERTQEEKYIEPKKPELSDDDDLIWPYVGDEE